MLNYSQAFYQLKEKLQPLYDADEAAAIAHTFLEYITGLNKLDRLTRKDRGLTPKQHSQYDIKAKELLAGRPIQYITTSAWFMGREFIVNEHVLIPRPETEELVQWVADEHKDAEKPRIADIGAGSGCIGISLQRLLPTAIVTCADISKQALDLIKTNIEWVLTPKDMANGVQIKLVEVDFLKEDRRNKALGRYDVIVSNPPYIPKKDAASMHVNVVKYEPAIALFVPDADPLVFYKALAAFGKEHLRNDGSIYCELDANHAETTKALFEAEGYTQTELRKDMSGKWRMLKAWGLQKDEEEA